MEVLFGISGVARGCGFQHMVMYVNLGTFYLVGMTVACVVGFKLKLYATVRQATF